MAIELKKKLTGASKGKKGQPKFQINKVPAIKEASMT